MQVAADSELLIDGEIAGAEDVAESTATDDADSVKSRRPGTSVSPWRAVLVGLAIVTALAGLLGWLGFRVHQGQREQAQRSQFLQAARQGAVNLTTIDWHHADSDVQRILDGATGQFYDDFAKRSQPFVDVVKQVQATTVGRVTEAGLESQTADTAQVLVAAAVQTSNAGVPEQVPRAWRMRIFVRKVDGQLKVSNVEFVS